MQVWYEYGRSSYVKVSHYIKKPSQNRAIRRSLLHGV